MGLNFSLLRNNHFYSASSDILPNCSILCLRSSTMEKTTKAKQNIDRK